MFNIFNIFKRRILPKINGSKTKKIKDHFITLEQVKDELVINIQCIKTGNSVSIYLEDMDDLYDWIDEQEQVE